MKEGLVAIGKITSAHGIRGEVKLQSHTASPRDIASYGPLTDPTGTRQFTLTLTGEIKQQLIARIDGVTDRNAAEALRGTVLCIPREKLPEPEEDDGVYLADLIGCSVILEGGAAFGTVTAYHNYGAGDLLEIRLADSEKTELFVFTEENFPEIDLENQRLVLTPPDIL